MLNAEPKDPSECADMADIRHEIDQIDRHLISVLGRRLGFVQAAAKFKTSESSVRARDRVTTMLDDRERWATQAGLDPVFIRELYVDMIEYFTERELREWASPQK